MLWSLEGLVCSVVRFFLEPAAGGLPAPGSEGGVVGWVCAAGLRWESQSGYSALILIFIYLN